MGSAPSLLRFSCGAGLSVLVFSVSVAGLGGEAHADGGAAAASPDDMTLDLGGATLETRRVPHGAFTLGSAATEVGHDKDEEPAHHVTITKDYWIGKVPVTRGQFAKFVADTRYVSDAEKGQAGGSGWAGAVVPDGGKGGPVLVQKKEFTWRHPGFTQTDEHPVVLVSYGDANAFVGWASRKSGKRVRLPTEAEWEYAARAGTTTSWSGGAAAESEPAAYGWFKPNAGNGTRPVGQKKANPFGLFDMSGNVMEWCRDVYAPYREGALVDPEVTTNTSSEPERRVLRGGSWFRDPKRGRSAARYKNTPGSRNADNGFRVVVTNEELVTPGVTGPGPDFVPAAPLGAAGTSGGAGSSGATSSASGGSGGPLADGEPIRTGPVAQPGDAFSWGLLLASPVAAASAVVAWMLLRRKRTPGGASARAAARASGVSGPASTSGVAHAERPTGPGAVAAPPSPRRPPPPVPSRAPPPVPQSSRSVTAPLPPPPPPPSPSRPASHRPPVMREQLDSVIIEAASSEPILAAAPIEEILRNDAEAAAAHSEEMAAADTLASDALTSQQALAAAAAADAALEANEAAKPSEEPATTSEEVAKPSEEVVKPSEEVVKPSEEPAKPSEEPAKPSEGAATMSEEVVKLSEESATASSEAAQPSEEPAKPNEEPAKPSEEPAKPSEEPAKPSEEPAKPSEEPAKPSEEPAKPSEEPAKPSEKPAKPSEEPAKPSDEAPKASEEPAKASEAPKPTDDAEPAEPPSSDKRPSSKPPAV